MKPAGCRALARGRKTAAPLFKRLLFAAFLSAGLSACATSFDVSPSTEFDASSKTAIVVVGTSVSRAQDKGVGSVRRLETYWQEYDPSTLRLRPGGESFVTRVGASPVAEPEYLSPTVSVLQVDPGSYALIGAGFPHLMTLYVPLKDSMIQRDSRGRLQSWTYTVDPRRHVDPEAGLDPRGNVLFTVEAGQILYIGHFQFLKYPYIDSLRSMDYSLDEESARDVLDAFPGISGEMITLDLQNPWQSVSR